MVQKSLLIAFSLAAIVLTRAAEAPPEAARSGNPLFPGWYADPEAIIIGDEYWIYPTYSAPFNEQLHFDAFSSKDLDDLWRVVALQHCEAQAGLHRIHTV